MVRMSPGLIGYMAGAGGSIHVELRHASDPAVALRAMQEARTALFDVGHPECADEPLPSFASRVVAGERGPTFWFDAADVDAYPWLVDQVVAALAAAVDGAGGDGVLSWPAADDGPSVAPPPPEGEGPARPGRWIRRAPHPAPQPDMRAVAGPDGRVYTIGGTEYGVRSVHAYDPAEDRWIDRAPMVVERRKPGVAVGTDGRIYAIGGFAGRTGGRTVEAYDPSEDRWELVAPLGGVGGSNDMVGCTDAGGVIHALALSSGTAADGSRLPHAFQSYDVAADTWTLLPSPAEASLRLVPLPDGRIVTFTARWGEVPRIVAYDPWTGAWSESRGPGSPVGFRLPPPIGAVTFAVDRRGAVYAVGDEGVVAFDHATGGWERLPHRLTPRTEPAVAADGEGTLYVIGGRVLGATTPAVESLRWR
ncbi:MAG TPA: hypothetical protein VFJ85_03095 [Acidimicrobiales bacterium]|nr:hypothetical protein [Acidimicrobiales bacterium]